MRILATSDKHFNELYEAIKMQQKFMQQQGIPTRNYEENSFYRAGVKELVRYYNKALKVSETDDAAQEFVDFWTAQLEDAGIIEGDTSMQTPYVAKCTENGEGFVFEFRTALTDHKEILEAAKKVALGWGGEVLYVAEQEPLDIADLMQLTELKSDAAMLVSNV